MTEIPDGMPAPDVDGQASLPRRVGPKGLPSTRIERILRVCYVGCYGSNRETRGTRLDPYPTAPILDLNGAKTLILWDRLVVCELVEN